MTPADCPVCGESFELGDRISCPECGARLTAEVLAAARRAREAFEEAEAEAAPAAHPALSDEDADELLAAFRSQFERHEVRLPKSWGERLRKLARETEAGRRQATIIFVDLRGYTRLSQLLSESQLDRLRQWFYEICTRRVELHGGFIIQFLGDAAYATFGAPWAFERDAESAIQALLEIREEVRAKGNYEGHELAIRAGADTGTVNVRLTEEHGRARPDLFGSPVNLAARLEAQAETWEILVSDTLADQVKGIFDLHEKPAWTPKNYGREVIPFAVLAHRREQAVRRRQDLKFVGRAAELGRMRGWMARAEAGEFVLASIEGDAGIGKTRLIQEAALAAQTSGMRVSRVTCDPHDRHTLLRSVMKLLDQIAGWGDSEPQSDPLPPEKILSKLAELFPAEQLAMPSVGYVLGAEPCVQLVSALPAKELRKQVVFGLRAVLEAAVRRFRPWVILADDMQWNDPLSMEVLEQVASRQPQGLLLVLSGRAAPAEMPAESVEKPRADLAESLPAWTRAAERLELAPLSESERLDLLSQVIEIGRLHPIIRNRLLAECEGVPLYMLELAREATERPDDAQHPAFSIREDGADPAGLSAALIDLLQARIDKLSRQRRALLQCGAALGRRFDLRAIKVFETLHAEILSELYALKGLQMLRDESLPEDIAFFFTPTVLRDVAYRMLTPDQRISLHATIARGIERRFADRLAAFSYELAVHWVRAGQPVRGRPYFRRAAQRALAQGLPQEAYELVRLAMQAPETREGAQEAPAEEDALVLQQRAVMEEIGGRACRLMGDYKLSDGHFRAFGALAEQTQNQSWMLNSLLQLALNSIERGEMAEAEAQLLSLSENRQDEEINARARNGLGIVRLRTGKLQAALQDFRNLAESLAGNERLALTAADAWNNAGLCHWQAGDLERSREAFKSGLEIWRKLGNLYGQALTLSNMGIASEKLGRWDEAEDFYKESALLAERIGYVHALSAVEANRANLSLLRRRWRDAEEQSARALQSARLIAHKNSEAIALENLGLALGGLGLLEESLSQLDEAIALGASMNDPVRRDSARLAAASVTLHAGEYRRVRDYLDAVDRPPSPDLGSWHETISLTLDLMDGVTDSADRLTDSLEELQRTGTIEDYLRRLDALALLSEAGKAGEQSQTWRERRAACFEN